MSTPKIIRRSESDMLSGAPIQVLLGNKSYEIPILNNRKAAKWREQLFELLGPLVANIDFGGIDLNANQQAVSEAMARKMSEQMISFPENLLELLFAYSGDAIPRDAVLAENSDVTDEQIALAFSQVSEVGYPFFFHLLATQRALATTAQKMPTPPRQTTMPATLQ